MSYDKDKQFKDGDVLNAAELNELVEGINESVIGITLNDEQKTLDITKRDNTLPVNLNDIVKAGITSNANTWADEDKAAACEKIGAATQSYVDEAIAAAIDAALQGEY